MMIKVTVRGDIDFDPVINDLRTQSIRAVRKASEYILQQSKTNIPHDTGLLENSGATDYEYLTSQSEAIASVFYDTPYAIATHEDLTRNYRNGRKPKYLEDAVRKNISKVRAIFQSEVSRAFR